MVAPAHLFTGQSAANYGGSWSSGRINALVPVAHQRFPQLLPIDGGILNAAVPMQDHDCASLAPANKGKGIQHLLFGPYRAGAGLLDSLHIGRASCRERV